MGRREGTLEEVVKTWQGRRVFLTGHTGFKGSWLALWLSRLGAQIRGYALDPCTEPNMFNLASVGTVVDDVRGDVRDYAKLEASMTEFAPEVVFHLAAQPIVRRSYADPVGTYGTNVMGTVHLMEAIRKTPSVRAVVCVTTDKCYQNQEWIWPYRETIRLADMTRMRPAKPAPKLSARHTAAHSFRSSGCMNTMWPWLQRAPAMSLAEVTGPRTGSFPIWSAGSSPDNRF